MDFELYSRVTGSPMPMSAAERMKMAPEVYQFTKDYTKSQNRQAMGRNILKIGAVGAGLGALYLANRGSRDFGTPSQELGQELTETSTAANLVENAAEKAAQSVGSNTVSQSLATDQTPALTEENAVETAEEPSMLNKVGSQIEDAPLLGAEAIREKYASSRVKNPERRARELESDMIGSESFGSNDKGKSILNKFVKDMSGEQILTTGEDIGDIVSLTGKTAPDFENVSVDDKTNPLDANLYGAFATSLASPLEDHPDVAGGEDDINLPGGMNTSSTVKITKDPKTLGIATNLPKTVGKTPEERIVIASIVNEKRQPSPNELAGKDQAAFEAIQAGIPKEEQEAAGKRVKEKTARKKPVVIKLKDPSQIKVRVTDIGAGGKEYVRKDEISEKNAPQTTTEKVDNFTANFVEGAKSDIIRGQRGNKSLGITSIPATNGDAQTGFVIANRSLDQSPDTATVYNFGVDAAGEDYLKDYPITEQNYDTMMDRGMGESRRKKRQAGQIFSYLAEADRNVTGQAQLGEFGRIDPNFRLASRRD